MIKENRSGWQKKKWARLLRSIGGLKHFLCSRKPIASARCCRGSGAVLARVTSDRQLLLNSDCFRFTGCERVWLKGCDPSEGGPSPPHLPSLPFRKGGGEKDCGKRGGVSCCVDWSGISTKTRHLLLPGSTCCHMTSAQKLIWPGPRELKRSPNGFYDSQMFLFEQKQATIQTSATVFSLIETYQSSDVAVIKRISLNLWLAVRGQLLPAWFICFKDIPIKEPLWGWWRPENTRKLPCWAFHTWPKDKCTFLPQTCLFEPWEESECGQIWSEKSLFSQIIYKAITKQLQKSIGKLWFFQKVFNSIRTIFVSYWCVLKLNINKDIIVTDVTERQFCKVCVCFSLALTFLRSSAQF